METVIPDLERCPGMGRLVLERPAGSVEVANGIARLTQATWLSRQGRRVARVRDGAFSPRARAHTSPIN